MMESTDLGKCDDLASGRRLDRARIRTVFIWQQMRSAPMIITKIARQNATEVRLIEDDGQDLLNSHRPGTIWEANTIRCISVSQQIARCGVPRKGLGDLPRVPGLGQVLGDLEMDNSSSVVTKNDHCIQQLKRHVASMNMSTAAMTVIWFRRKLRQVGEGALGRRGKCLPTVAWLTSMPSLSSSPWMRGAPQSGLARLI